MTGNRSYGIIYRVLFAPGTAYEGWPMLTIHICMISLIIGTISAVITGDLTSIIMFPVIAMELFLVFMAIIFAYASIFDGEGAP